jgi:ATP-dependent DNA ligase
MTPTLTKIASEPLLQAILQTGALVYYSFDLLELKTRAIVRLTLLERKEHLAGSSRRRQRTLPTATMTMASLISLTSAWPGLRTPMHK